MSQHHHHANGKANGHGAASPSPSPSSDYPRKQSFGNTGIRVESAIPKKRQDMLKWNGWGYKDSKFTGNHGVISFSGDRYPIGGHVLPYFFKFVGDNFNVDISDDPLEYEPLVESAIPPSLIAASIVEEVNLLGISWSTDNVDRVVRSHGQTLHEIDKLRRNIYTRIPDLVVWPTCHEEVVKLVELADAHRLVIVPVGGATSVSGALECPADETRPIVSLDTSQMNDILWVDRDNLVVCCESGILGQDLERELKKIGFTVGHEPDSYEFSSLGGWVATRASGMKKNTYGNIEDLVVHVRMVTPRGVLEKGCRVPRLSCGPDFNHVILGSEGSFGVITEVILKIRPVPKCTRYGSVVFPDFDNGVHFMREVARDRLQPSSIRLMDNQQVKFGLCVRKELSYFDTLVEGLKNMYISMIKGFDMDQLCITTLLFEGDEDETQAHEKKLYTIAAKHGGIPAGARNGERGYVLTFVIAYIRDLAYDYSVIAESFETSVPWDRTIALCRNVKHCVSQECTKRGINYFLISCRVTQTYDAGCCIYFYFGFRTKDIDKDIVSYEYIEEKARDEIIASGGSISHHHGVGKIRRKWYTETVSKPGVNVYRATKRELDPNNVFANRNLIDESYPTRYPED